MLVVCLCFAAGWLQVGCCRFLLMGQELLQSKQHQLKAILLTPAPAVALVSV